MGPLELDGAPGGEPMGPLANAIPLEIAVGLLEPPGAPD